jgi:hypothetical protein
MLRAVVHHAATLVDDNKLIASISCKMAGHVHMCHSAAERLSQAESWHSMCTLVQRRCGQYSVICCEFCS